MKALLSFVFCVLHVSFAQDGAKSVILKNAQTRPLHKPEAQNNPVIVPVPVYTPLQQYPVQQYPPIQQHPVQQIPVQQYPVQQYPVQQFIPVHQVPVYYPQHQQYPQMQHPHFQHHQFYPQYHHGIPC